MDSADAELRRILRKRGRGLRATNVVSGLGFLVNVIVMAILAHQVFVGRAPFGDLDITLPRSRGTAAMRPGVSLILTRTGIYVEGQRIMAVDGLSPGTGDLQEPDLGPLRVALQVRARTLAARSHSGPMEVLILADQDVSWGLVDGVVHVARQAAATEVFYVTASP